MTVHRHGEPPCRTVRELIGTRITDIDRTIAELQALRATLTSTRHDADLATVRPAAVCPIIDPAH